MKPAAIFSADPALGWLPWGALAPFLGIVFVAVPLLGVSAVLQHFQLLDTMGNPVGLPGLHAFLIFPFTMIGLVVLLWVRFIERRPLATIGLTAPKGATLFIRGHLVGLVTAFALVAAIWIAGGFEARGYAHAFAAPGVLVSMGLLFLGFALQSSVEELLFRGWLLSVLARKFNVLIAVLLTSVVFTLLHLAPEQPWLVILSSFLFSVFACCWALNAASLWGVMGWHAGWNWLLAVGFQQPVTGIDAHLPALLVELSSQGPDYLTGGSEGPEGSVICSVLFACAILFLLWRNRGTRRDAL